MSFSLFKKSVSDIKYKKVANSYKFTITFNDADVLKFMGMIIGDDKNVVIKGKKLDFSIDRDEATAGQFIDFARIAGLLKG